MNKHLFTKDDGAGVLIAILFLVIGFLAVWSMKAVAINAGDAVFVSLLLVPLMAYVILTGRLKELKAPGGLEAKFGDVARQPAVELASQRVEFVEEDMSVIAKSGVQELERLAQLADASKRIIMTLLLGRKHYDGQDAETYIERFLRYHNFKYVVFLDKKDRFVAYIAPWTLFRILQGEQSQTLIDIINKGDVMELLDFPGVMIGTISTSASNMDALRAMTAHGLDAMPVIDQEHKLKGVVEREQVLSKLMIGMVS